MNPYFAGSFILAIFAFLDGLIWYANRSGRHSAEVSNSERDTTNANATTAATQRMLSARTNSVRDEDALIGELNKGGF